MSSLLDRVVIPVAGPEDAANTYESFRPQVVDPDGTVDTDVEIHVVYVVKKAGGAPDKAGVEQREEHARDAFDRIGMLAGADGLEIDSEIRYSTDVADAIIEYAGEVDASAIAFTSRGTGKWLNLITGGVRSSLLLNADRPVVVLPTDMEE
ncbi:universal stress protein UspA [Halalkaliarchaeum desulfuricum]|uniref:Universal stress protein UspA n=1 Tax=Halalkaliarchaeum desulfuricum TaxID=2055893 RepID=A0A343TMU6_9EURY|nr:universal stress protein [Halalkaliarchaeum desulfuricum]AUX10418.1 universal stress protein UspA [Halalkaliarchaeum desulfuricum]